MNQMVNDTCTQIRKRMKIGSCSRGVALLSCFTSSVASLESLAMAMVVRAEFGSRCRQFLAATHIHRRLKFVNNRNSIYELVFDAEIKNLLGCCRETQRSHVPPRPKTPTRHPYSALTHAKRIEMYNTGIHILLSRMDLPLTPPKGSARTSFSR